MFESLDSNEDVSPSDGKTDETTDTEQPRSRLGQLWFELPDEVKWSLVGIPAMFAGSFLPGKHNSGPMCTTWAGHTAFALVFGTILGVVTASRLNR